MTQGIRSLTLVAVGLAAATAIHACADPSGPAGPPEPTGEFIVAFDQDLGIWPRDAWDFQEVSLDGDRLALSVSYGGGCENHDLWLLAVDGFQALPDAGPTPTVAVPLLLAHDAHDDPCEAYLTRTDTFDLAPLRAAFRDRYGTPGRIFLRVPEGQGGPDSVAVDFTVD